MHFLTDIYTRFVSSRKKRTGKGDYVLPFILTFMLFLYQMALCHAPCTTSPPPLVLTPMAMPLPLNSRLRRVIMSSHTPSSPSTPPCLLTARATRCPLLLHPPCLPTIYQAPVPRCLSIFPLSTRHCSTCPFWAQTLSRGSTSTTYCRGWRFRDAEWCSTRRESLCDSCFMMFVLLLFLTQVFHYDAVL